MPPEPTLVVPPGRQGPGPMPEAAVRALELAVGRRIAGRMPGEHRALGVGQGTEIAQLRPYAIGDDVRQLDPAASARTGEPWVRQHVPERALTTWLLVDVSPSMAFGSVHRLKSDVAEGVAQVAARAGLRRAGRVGLLTYGRPDPLLVAPRGGRRATVAVRQALEAGVAADGYDDPRALAAALTRVGRLARQPGLVVVVGDLRGDDGWQAPIRALATRHEVVVVDIQDPRETTLPDAGLVVLVDPETGAQVEADLSSPKLRAAFATAEAQRAAGVRADLRRAGARHAVVSTEGDWLRDLGKALSRRDVQIGQPLLHPLAAEGPLT